MCVCGGIVEVGIIGAIIIFFYELGKKLWKLIKWAFKRGWEDLEIACKEGE
jgi:hypothetical protein